MVVVAVLLLAGLTTGGIGDSPLVHLGPAMGTLVLPLLGVVVLATGLVIAVLATDLVPWTRRSIASLRERVDAAESAERGEAPTAPTARGRGRGRGGERSSDLNAWDEGAEDGDDQDGIPDGDRDEDARDGDAWSADAADLSLPTTPTRTRPSRPRTRTRSAPSWPLSQSTIDPCASESQAVRVLRDHRGAALLEARRAGRRTGCSAAPRR